MKNLGGTEMANILIDIDGTLNDLPNVLHRFANVFNRYELWRTNTPDLSKYELTEAYGWDKADEKIFWDKYGILAFHEAYPRAGAYGALKALQNAGHQLHYVTARSNTYYSNVTHDWFKRHDIPADSLNIGAKTKWPFEEALKPALILEDHPDKYFPGHDPEKHPPIIVMSWPYNQHLKDRPGLRLVDSWMRAEYEMRLLKLLI
jgi:uncharacterized HAD superfamily protein